MGDFPDIFQLLQRFDPLRGSPAAYLVLLTAACIFVLRDWRWSVLALTGQYLAAGLLFVDVLDVRLAVTKVLVGLFLSLIMYVTARQVNWGNLPVDVTVEEAVQLQKERHIRFGPYMLPTDTRFRVFLALMMILVVWTLSQRSTYHLPAVPEHFNLAVYALIGLGIVNFSLTTEPLQAGIGLLTFLTGFELFYGALEQSAAILAFLAAADLIVALVIAYLVQTRHALTALLD